MPPTSSSRRGGRRGRRRALLIIDMSVEQVGNLTYNKRRVISTIASLASSSSTTTTTAFDMIIDSHLWIGPDDVTSLTNLYPDVGRVDTPGARLIPELEQATTACRSRDVTSTFVPKYNYSSFVDTPLADLLRHHGIEDVYLTGINTDYCIFATALDAFYARFNVMVVEDGVSSVGGRIGHEQGLDMIRKFGCADIVTAREVLDELLLVEK